jgi:hypothetical protein
VVAAVHTAADAITHVAAGDREAVRAAAADHRLYAPAFTRTNAAVVRRRYRPASPISGRRDPGLLRRCDRNEHPGHGQVRRSRYCARCSHLAPGGIARATTTRPGRLPAWGTSAPQRSANSPARHRGVGAQVGA